MKTLISALDIKAYTSVSLNLEAHRLDITIPDAQQRHLRPLLGAALLDQLLGLVDGAPDAPTATIGAAAQLDAAQAAYATALSAWRTTNAGPMLDLLDQVKPVLAQWALVEAWPNLLVHVENAGVVLRTGKSEGTTSADVATLNQVATAHRATAVWRGEELVRWLESKKSAYPAYQSSQPLATGQQPIDEFGGISL